MQPSNNWSNPAPSMWNQTATPQQPSQAAGASNPPSSSWSNPAPSMWNQTALVQQPPQTASSLWGQNPLSAWGQLVQPASDHGRLNQVGNDSRQYVVGAAGQDGPLSNKTHADQMRVVDTTLNDLVEKSRQNRNDVSEIVSAFVQRVMDTMRKIGQYQASILDRVIRDDPTITPDTLIKAKLIVTFSTEAVFSMKSQSEAALDLASKGMGNINGQTLDSVKLIFQARALQVTLFEQKLKVFQNQELHELEIVTQVQAIKLKEHEHLFKQLLEISQQIEKQRDGEAKRVLEANKAHLEAEIQLRGQSLKEEEVHNKHQLDTTKLEYDQTIAAKMADIKAREQEENAANQRLQIIEQELTARQRDLQNAQTERERTEATMKIENLKTERQAEMQQAQIASQERQHNLDTIASIIKPPCSIQ